MPDEQPDKTDATGSATVTTHIAKLPGMATGEVGISGMDKAGPSIRTVAVPAWQFIAVEVGWSWLHSFFGLLSIDGLGLADLAPPGDAFSHLYRIGGMALAPATLSCAQQLYAYLSKVRAARGLN